MQPPQHLCNKTAPNASRLQRRFVGVKGASLPVAAANAAEICSGKYFNRGGGMGGKRVGVMRRFELGLHTDVCSVHMAAGIPKPVLAFFFFFFGAQRRTRR